MRTNRIGALRHRLVLEQAVRVADGGGGASETWSGIVSLWAQIRPLSGHELVEAQRITGQVTHDITVRFRADIKPEMRLRKDTRIFYILSVTDADERGHWSLCRCEERNL